MRVLPVVWTAPRLSHSPLYVVLAATNLLVVVTRTGLNPGTVARVIPLAGKGIHPSSVGRARVGT